MSKALILGSICSADREKNAKNWTMHRISMKPTAAWRMRERRKKTLLGKKSRVKSRRLVWKSRLFPRLLQNCLAWWGLIESCRGWLFIVLLTYVYWLDRPRVGLINLY
jgi:hypothetical protein